MKTTLLFALALLLCTQLHAQKLFTGVWRSGNDGYYLWSGVSWKDFNDKWAELAKKNLRLTDIETYTSGNNRYFSGVWREGNDGYALTPAGLDWAGFNKFWSDYSKKGLRLIDIETYEEGSKRYYLGVFRQGNDGYALSPGGLDWAGFNKFWSDYSKKGLRLIDIETYTSGGKRYFLGVMRAGNDGYVLSPLGKDWGQFVSYWDDLGKKNLRLIDIESYVENGKRLFLGVWREGSDGYYLWHGEDWESLTSKWAENNAGGLRLIDFETFDSDCPSKCLNNVLMPDDPKTTWRDGYDYGIYATATHCEGAPGTCPTPAAGDKVYYRWPNLKIGSDYYMRNSVVMDAKDQIFTLPFKETSSQMSHNGWLYDKGSWHHAIDYSKSGAKTFQVRAAAPGKVIYIGWDEWSGNTMIISHDAGGKKDVYRTIYMHLRNGPANDCENAWSKTVPTLSTDPDPAKDQKTQYKNYLNNTGCPLNKTNRDPKSDWWGTDAQKLDMSLVGKTVNAGDPIGWSGSTGPGGCGCVTGGSGPNTHLHIFFAHKDPADGKWYFFDPYGIYAYGDCYPAAVDAAINTPCARYPVAWKNGKPTAP